MKEKSSQKSEKPNYKPPYDWKCCLGCGRETNSPEGLCSECGGDDHVIPDPSFLHFRGAKPKGV